MFFGRKPRTDASEQAGVVGEIGGTIDVMPDFMGENFQRKLRNVLLLNLPQADDDGVIHQTDHREAAGKLFALLVFGVETPMWRG
jgi:hypothetical protein